MTKKYRQAASVLVVRPSNVCSPDGCEQIFSVLLVHKPRKCDAWQLPQGGIEEGETMSQAGLRELEEETGISGATLLFESSIRYKYDFSRKFHKRHNPINDGQELLFVVVESPKDPKVTVDNREIDTYRWVEPQDIGKFIDRKEYLDTIIKLLDEYRTHHASS